jgi:hypothetical protein
MARSTDATQPAAAPASGMWRVVIALVIGGIAADIFSGGAVTQPFRDLRGAGGSGSRLPSAALAQTAAPSTSAEDAPGAKVAAPPPAEGAAPAGDVDAKPAGDSAAATPPTAWKAKPLVAAAGVLRYGARTAPTAIAPAADSGAGCFPACAPLVMKHGELFVQRSPNATTEPELMRVSHMTPAAGGAGPYYAFPPTVKRIIVDIGTNADPDSDENYWQNKDIGMLWFEPQVTLHTHPMHLEHTRRSITLSSNRVVGFPAAVAPDNGHMMIHLSAVSGCTSLLPMNNKALKQPDVMGDSFSAGKGDKTFKNYAESKGSFTGCIQTNNEAKRAIPVVRGEAVLKFIDPKLDIFFLMVDAQGFDLNVAASMGAEAGRIDNMMLECQDLPAGHGMFLTEGAFSCADMIHCIHANLPHRLVAASTGEPANTCTTNSPSHERNCIFRRMDRPKLFKNPKIVDRAVFEIKQPMNEKLKCPDFRIPADVKAGFMAAAKKAGGGGNGGDN